MSSLTPADENYLRMAIELSRRAWEDEWKTPFGAVLVLNGEVVSEGTSSVIELIDPSAHAEVMALRNAAQKLMLLMLSSDATSPRRAHRLRPLVRPAVISRQCGAQRSTSHLRRRGP